MALEADYVDKWGEKLNIHDAMSVQPLLNYKVVHHIVQEIAKKRSFAIVETNYFGGIGGQSAAVYCDGVEFMAPGTSRSGSINSALRLVGVYRRRGKHEFESLGLDRHRDWGDLLLGDVGSS